MDQRDKRIRDRNVGLNKRASCNANGLADSRGG